LGFLILILVWGLGFGVYGLVLLILILVSGFGFRVSGFGFRVSRLDSIWLMV
jgi:hypothetical protein